MLGERLKALRKSRKMTQEDVAKALGLSKSTVGMYEQGRRQPDNNNLAALCKLFCVSSDYFLLDGPVSNGNPLPQDNTDLNEIIHDFRDRLLRQEGLMFNGITLSENEIVQVVSAIEVGAMVAVNKITSPGAKQTPTDREEGEALVRKGHNDDDY